MLWDNFDVNYGMSDKIQKYWCTKALGRCLCPPNAFPVNHTKDYYVIIVRFIQFIIEAVRNRSKWFC